MTGGGPDYNAIAQEEQEIQEGLIEIQQKPKKNYEEILKEQYNEVGFGFFQILLAICCGSGFFVNGMEITFVYSIEILPIFPKKTPQNHKKSMIGIIMLSLKNQWDLSKFQTGSLASAIFLGMAIGAAFGGMIADRSNFFFFFYLNKKHGPDKK